MINLLPSEQVGKVEAEYRYRRHMMSGTLSLAWLAILALVIFSGYILIRANHSALEQQLVAGQERLQKKTDGDTNAAELSTLAAQLEVIQVAEATRTLPFEILERIITVKPPGIKINFFNFKHDPGAPDNPVVELRGVAETRGDLLDFLEQLKSDKSFTAANSPVANLIKERGADFTITLLLASHG